MISQRLGSQVKNRYETKKALSPHAATMTRSIQLNVVPTNPACIPRAKCRTGNIRAIHTIHVGALELKAMKIPERNNSGRMLAFTIAGAASALGITHVMANPRAQNFKAPTISMMRNFTSDQPVGKDEW